MIKKIVTDSRCYCMVYIDYKKYNNSKIMQYIILFYGIQLVIRTLRYFTVFAKDVV